MENKKRKATMAIMNTNWGLPLPSHLVLVIFSKLPFFNLSACRQVCKSWNHLVLDYASCLKIQLPILFTTVDRVYNPHDNPPLFFINQTVRCFDIDTLSFVASCLLEGPPILYFYTPVLNCCNGLLYIDRGGKKDLNDRIFKEDLDGIFNPMTGEFFQTTPTDKVYHEYYHGFGFSPKTKQYKLYKGWGSIMRVLSFGRYHNQWMNLTLPSSMTLISHGAYMDGVVYWAGRENGNKVIYALDVKTGKFEMSGVLEVSGYCPYVELQPFNGTIYAIAFVAEPIRIEVWKMLEKDSWAMDFIVLGRFWYRKVRLVKACEDGNIFLISLDNLFCLSDCESNNKSNKYKTMKKIQTLIPYKTRYMGHFLLESIHFGSLSNILAGIEE